MITGIMELATLAFLLHSFFICHDDLKSQTHHTVTSLTIAALLLPLLFLVTLFCRSCNNKLLLFNEVNTLPDLQNRARSAKILVNKKEVAIAELLLLMM